LALAASFKLLGPAHLVVIALTVAAPALLILLARKVDSPRFTKALGWAIALVLLGNELGFYIRQAQYKTLLEFAQDTLPLHLCGIAMYLTIITLFTRKQILFEIACFWGLVGTPQAILTPAITVNFPDYWFFQFFVCHCGIIVGVVYAIGALKMRPRRGAMWRIFVITNICLLLIGAVDFLIGANYMYLREVPQGDSPLIAWGWPWHIVIAVSLMLLGFWIVERILAPKSPTRE
jgi:hypothetical integral membrane protein (TIGR02206 family)